MIDLKEMESAQQSAQRFNEAVAKAALVSFERGYTDGFADGYKQGQKDAQPEIIYCKDCKHYALHSLFGRSFGLCERLCNESHTILTENNDFCSQAERA